MSGKPLKFVCVPTVVAAATVALAQDYPTRPVRLVVASAPGGGTDISARLILKIVHVPYKGQGPALLDVIAGHVHLMMSNILSALPHVKNGRIRALGVTSPKRATVFPGIPTIAETGVPGYEVVQWYGILAPAATPRDIIATLHAATVRALQDPAIRAHFINDGGEPIGGTPEEFAAVIRADLKKWGKVVKDMGIKPDQR